MFVSFILTLLLPARLMASSWDPTLLVNTESFQTIDDSNTTGDIELRFGDVINERVYWDRTPGRFRASDDLYVDTDLTASGTLSVEGAATFGSTVRVNNVTYTFPSSDGSASGKVLKTSAAGVLSWSDDSAGGGMSFAEASSYYVNDTGDTMTGALTVAGLTVTAGNTLAVNGVTYTYPPSDGSASGKVLKTSGAGTLSWSTDSTLAGATGATMDVWSVTGYNCGAATTYLGFNGVAFANATEATADTTLRLASNITVTGLRCFQPTDASCLMNARVRKNAANAAGTPNCRTSNVGTCGSSTGVVTFTNGDEISIQLIDAAASCTDAIACYCAITYTW